jgi:alpha-glucosidase (family GH31 glycosyl hydrolase)
VCNYILICTDCWEIVALVIKKNYLAQSIDLSSFAVILQSLSGQPFSGPDIRGFAGDSTPKLFARWMGIGTMMPFARGHSEKGTIDQEPWSFGPEVASQIFHKLWNLDLNGVYKKTDMFESARSQISLQRTSSKS